MENHVEKLRELLAKCNVCMLGTFDDESRVTFRPMAHVDVDDLGNIWFFVGVDSPKAAQVNANPNVYLNFSCETETTYVTIEGVATISNINRDRIRELFSPFVRSWFPLGLEDPQLGLMVVHPLEIDYWVNDESKILTYIKMLTKTAAGAKSMVAEHGKILM
jgi:general stress protein 26